MNSSLAQQVNRMKNKDRRQFIRVDVQQEAFLDFGEMTCPHSVNNLSLGGIFVKGLNERRLGDTCLIRLKPSQSTSEVIASGLVVRITPEGTALKFTSMTIDSLLFLQTMLLDETSDSLVLGSEPVGYLRLHEAATA